MAYAVLWKVEESELEDAGQPHAGATEIWARVTARWESEGSDSLCEVQTSNLKGAVLDLGSLVAADKDAVTSELRRTAMQADREVVAEDTAKALDGGGLLDALPEELEAEQQI